MNNSKKPTIISAPEPRNLDLIFTQAAKDVLFSRYKVVECSATTLYQLDEAVLNKARYIIGQPPVNDALLDQLRSLKAVLNVEGNLFNNMPYERLFAEGIHVTTTAAVFAEPVAELGLALALNLLRDVIQSDQAFTRGKEIWGLKSTQSSRLLSGSQIGLVGFGELGRALNKLLTGFNARISAYDPWLPPSTLIEHDVVPATLQEILENSDVVFVVASVTSENEGFLDAAAFNAMRAGSALILLSRAAVVNFDDLMEAVRSGHIIAASDVFPEEPLPANHPVRTLPNFICSAHRAGALDIAFKRMGDRVLEDMALMDKGLPPIRCKRAERETVNMMRSIPVDTN